MWNKKRVPAKRLHFSRNLIIIIICITLFCVNASGLLNVNAETDKVGKEEIVSEDETTETTNAKKAATDITGVEETETETETETASEIETETISESEMVPKTEIQKTDGTVGIARAGIPVEVDTWQAFIDALADSTVDHILLTANLARTASLPSNNPGTIARDLIIEGGGYSIDFGSGILGISNSIELGKVSAATTLTLTNVTFIKTYQATTAMFESSDKGNNWNISLSNVKTNVGTGTYYTSGLIDASGASVTVHGTESNLVFKSNSSNTDLFNVGSFTMSAGSSMTATAQGSGSLFKVNNGNFIMGSGADLTAVSPETGINTAYLFDIAGSFTMEAGSQITASSAIASLFKVSGTFTMEDGATELIAESTSTSQSGNQFNINIGGDFVMGNGSTFTTTTATTNNSNNYYQVAAGNFTLKDNATLIAKSAGKSLFRIAGNFTVGEHATVTADSTNGANRQFSVKNFIAKANSSITTTSEGATYQFYITGNFTMESSGKEGTGAVLTANSGGKESNSIIYMLGSGTIDLGSYTKTYIKNSGRSSREGDNSPDNSHGIYGEVGALNMQAHSLLDIYATSVGYRTMVENSLTMVDGAVFNATGVNHSAIALTEDYSEFIFGNINTMPATINIDGAGTQLNLECSASNSTQGNYGAALIIAGTNKKGKSSILNLTNGAEINGHATSNSVIQVRSNGSVFTVKEGAKLNLVQDGGADACATLRFRYEGNQAFIIDNAEVNIQKLGGSTETVRMYNGNNSITVINGGRLDIYNKGNGSPNDGTGNEGNQGIHFSNGTTGNPDSFYVEGYGSVVKIVADNGPALSYTLGSTSKVQAMDGSTFILEGKTRNASYGGAIQSTSVAEFELNNPSYFDLRNNRSGGGRALNSAGRNTSKFTLENSDFSVWKQGKNLNGDPTKSWTLINFVLTGDTFNTILSTDFSSEFNTGTYEGSAAYSRMSANNESAVIDELRVSTNADKYIYGHAYLPESIDGIRDAWTDEVYVTVKVTNEDNTYYYLEGTTVGADDNGGLSVYGEPSRGGIFEILNDPDDDGIGKYLRTGQTLEVVSAYSTNSPINLAGTKRVHTSRPEDLIAPDVTTVDVTPPTALTLADLGEDVRMYLGNLTTRTTVISGISGEIGSKVYIYKNDALWANGEVGAAGTWSITLPGVLIDGDTIAIALNDNVPNAGNLTSYDLDKLVDNGIFANDGNENPSGNYIFHDATFSTRLELGVVYYGVLELSVSSEIEYGTHGISPGVTTYPAGTMELKVEDSRLFRNKWQLTASLEEPFTLNGGTDVLDIDLVYTYNSTETVIGSSAVPIWQHTNTSDMFDVYDQWEISGSGNGLVVRASAGDVKIGSYTAVINWVLSDVP